MKTKAICIAFLLIGFASFAQIPNSGFETWMNPNGYNVPFGWATNNDLTATANVFTCVKGAPGNPGQAYVKLISKNVSGMGVVNGIAVSGVRKADGTFSGYAFAERPINLTGNWQFMATGDDQGYISVVLTKWSSATASRDTISNTVHHLGSMVMSWRPFNIPIQYNNYNDPDTCKIILSASGDTPVATSYLYIDNLAFEGTTTGLLQLKSDEKILISPNPAIDFIHVDFSKITNKIISTSIADATGRIIATPENLININVSYLNSGIYLLNIQTSEGVISQRFRKL